MQFLILLLKRRSYIFACAAGHGEAVLGVHDYRQQCRQWGRYKPPGLAARLHQGSLAWNRNPHGRKTALLKEFWPIRGCLRAVWEERQEKEREKIKPKPNWYRNKGKDFVWPQMDYFVGSSLHVPSSQESEKRWGDTSQFSVNLSPAQKNTELKASRKSTQKIILLSPPPRLQQDCLANTYIPWF